MGVVTADLSVSTQGNNDVVDLTRDASDWLRDVGAVNGTLTVFTPHTTAGITALEFEPGANRDLGDVCERLIPEKDDYHHNAADTNGHAHARSALMGPSVQIPVAAGRLMLGTWQSIALVDFDDRPRTRSVIMALTS